MWDKQHSAAWVVQASSLGSKQNRSLRFQVGSQHIFLHLLKLNPPCLTAATSAGCSEWVQNCCSWAVLLPGSLFTHHSCHGEAISLRTGILPEVSREMFAFGKQWSMARPIWQTESLFHTNEKKTLSVTKLLLLVQSFSSQKYSTHVSSNTAAPSLEVTKEQNPGQY